MPKALVFDATPLIYIVRVSLVKALEELSNPKILPKSVFEELTQRAPIPRPESPVINDLVERGILKVQTPRDHANVTRHMTLANDNLSTPLHRAESEALALAKELGAVVLSDDKAARTVARMVGLELHGTGYLLGRMSTEGHLSKQQAVNALQDMRRSGWRLSEEDYRNVIEYLSNL